MPPVGNGQPIPQGPPPPMSIGSEAAGVAGGILDAANENPTNVPAGGENPSGFASAVEPSVKPPLPEEAIPSDLGNTQTPVKVPVEYPGTESLPPQPEATSDPLSAFAPKPAAGPYSQAPSALATLAQQSDQRVTPPEPDWKAMATSTKAGTEPTAPSAESPAAATHGELDQTKLDREAAGDPNMEKLYRFASENFKAAASLLEIANGIENPDERKRGLNATIPAVRKSLDTLEKNI